MLTVLGGLPARQVLDQLGAKVTDLLIECLNIAMQTCTTVALRPPGPTHYDPRAVARGKMEPHQSKESSSKETLAA